MKKMMFLSKNWYFSVQKAIIYYTFNKSHHNSFILLVFSDMWRILDFLLYLSCHLYATTFFCSASLGPFISKRKQTLFVT